MQLFPDRDEGGSRGLLPAALAISLLLHVLVGGTWAVLGQRIAPVVAKLFPQPSPSPEIVAMSDAITIEKRTVPRAARRTPPRADSVRPRPRRVAQLPAPRPFDAVSLPPLATMKPMSLPTAPPSPAPLSPPTAQAVHATIHRPRAAPATEPPTPEPTPKPTPRPTPRPTPSPRLRSAFSPEQLASLDRRFSKTIAQADRSLTDVVKQSRPPSTTKKRYSLIFAGTQSDVFTAQGECDKLQAWTAGGRDYYYLRCDYIYSDGYRETVSWPWPYSFDRRADPILRAEQGAEYASYPWQPPPADFMLPTPFALSRGVCIFFRERCEAVVRAEQAAGAPP